MIFSVTSVFSVVQMLNILLMSYSYLVAGCRSGERQLKAGRVGQLRSPASEPDPPALRGRRQALISPEICNPY
jgi:hypothetical protein